MRADRYQLCQHVVAYARTHGIKAATRSFGRFRNTVRKQVHRYRPGQPSSLAEISKRPHRCPHQTRPSLEGQIVRLRPRKNKHLTKRCLRAVKAQWPLLGQLVADTKHLCDESQMQQRDLPRFQYSVREVVSGLSFTGCADELSESYNPSWPNALAPIWPGTAWTCIASSGKPTTVESS